MHISVLTHNYPRFGGDFSGTFIEALCQEFATQQQRVTVWAPFDPKYEIQNPKHTIQNPDLRLYRYVWPARFHRLGYMRSMQSDLSLRLEAYALSPLLFLAGIATLLRESLRTRPDILHAHWLLPNGFIAAIVSRALGIPLVVSIPGSDAQVANANPLFRSMARMTLRQASLLTANSVELRDSVLNLVPTQVEKRQLLNKFDLIIYGTDPAALKPERTGVADLRQRLSTHNAHLLLCVGRMVAKKGFDMLIRSLTEPALRQRNVIAVMVGKGDEWEAWQQLAQELGVAERVRWVGFIPKTEIAIYYNACDILIMPSVSRPADGLNVCVLDAMSCGKAVIASNVAGNPLAVSDGETGFIVPEQDVSALAAAIAQLVDDAPLRTQMGQAGRRRIEDALGWPALAKRYLGHFNELLAPSK